MQHLLINMGKALLCITSLAILYTLPADGKSKRRKHSKKHHHAHGRGYMNIVLIDNKLMVELTVPMSDLVGFEGQAQSAEQKQAVATTTAQLQDYNKVIELPSAAGCELSTAASVQNTAAKRGKHSKRSKHADFRAVYTFTCATPQKLDRITATAFALSKQLEKIKARWITADQQLRKTLIPKAAAFIRER